MYVNHIATDKGPRVAEQLSRELSSERSDRTDVLHLSPYTNSSILQHQEHQWTSLSEPAVLPLTTDPTPEHMRVMNTHLPTGPTNDHMRHFWQLDVPRQEELSGIPYEFAMSAEELLQELLCQRLEQDFQLLRPRHRPKLLSLHQEQTYYVSKGDQVQQITFVQQEQPVVRSSQHPPQSRRHNAPSDMGRAPAGVGGRAGAGMVAAARLSSSNPAAGLRGAQGGGAAGPLPPAPQASFSEIRVTRHLLQARAEKAASSASGGAGSKGASSSSSSKRAADKALDYRYFVCGPHGIGYQQAAALIRPTTSFDQYPWNSLDQVVCGWDCALISLPMRPRCKRFALLDFSGAEDSLRRLLSAPEGTQRLLSAAIAKTGATPAPLNTPGSAAGLHSSAGSSAGGASGSVPVHAERSCVPTVSSGAPEAPPAAATPPVTPQPPRHSTATNGAASATSASNAQRRPERLSGVDDMAPRDVNAPSLSRDRFDRFREAVRSKLPIGDRVEWVEAAAAPAEGDGGGFGLPSDLLGVKGAGSALAQRTHSQLLDLTSADDASKGGGVRPRRMFVQLLFDANASGDQAWHLEIRWTMCQGPKVEELVKFCARRAKLAGLLLLQVPTGRRPRPFAPPVLVPIPSALQARALLKLRTELCFLRESVHAGSDLHAGRSTAALGDRWMHELGVAFVQRDKHGRGFLWSANRCLPSAAGRAHSIEMLARFREICEALTIEDSLHRAEATTGGADLWDWSDGRSISGGNASLDSSSSRAGHAIEVALQASESVPSPPSADEHEMERRKGGGGNLWLSAGEGFGAEATEASVGSAHS